MVTPTRAFRISDRRYERIKKAAKAYYDGDEGKTTDYLIRAAEYIIDNDLRKGAIPKNFMEE